MLVVSQSGGLHGTFMILNKKKLQFGKVKSLMAVWSSSFRFQNEVKLQRYVVGGELGKSGSWSVWRLPR